MIVFIRKIFAASLGKKATDDLFSGYMAKNSVRLFLMHCAALLLGVFSNYVLIKLAGVTAYGSYVYIFNLLYLLSVFCVMGTDTLLVKKAAVYNDALKHAELKGVIIFSFLITLAGAILVSVISSLVFPFTGILKDVTTINWFILSLLSLPMLSFIKINQGSLQGLKKIFLSQVSDKLIRPILLIAGVLLMFFIKGSSSIHELVWISVAAIAIAMLITFIFHFQSIRSKIQPLHALYDTGDWVKTSFAFFLISIFQILNARVDIFFLGLYKTSDEVGVYNIALRISEVISFGLMIVNFVLAPLVAKLYANGELAGLQKLITRSSRAVLMISLPLIVLILVFRHPLLSIFDADILNCSHALVILSLGHLINILCGSVGLLLVMTGQHKYSIISLFSATIWIIILNIVLVPAYGLTGSAIATSSGLVVWNLLMYFFVRKKLKIRTTALGSL